MSASNDSPILFPDSSTRIALPRKTERLLLRPYLSEDADAFYAYVSDAVTVRFEPYPPLDRAEAEAELAGRISNPDFIAICLPPDETHPFGHVIGHLFFSPCAFSTWEIGWMLHRENWHNGYAVEAASAAIGAAFADGIAHRVIAMCNPENTASVHLAQRLGMRHEGTLVRNLWFTRSNTGEPIWLDTAMYAILAEEWNTTTTN
ncbi:MAG: GNAT family N-acetyltransferase [Clostridia bacterium]|nr:GNAT family N-acetyltransferase [Clostridia bacterium]